VQPSVGWPLFEMTLQHGNAPVNPARHPARKTAPGAAFVEFAEESAQHKLLNPSPLIATSWRLNQRHTDRRKGRASRKRKLQRLDPFAVLNSWLRLLLAAGIA